MTNKYIRITNSYISYPEVEDANTERYQVHNQWLSL